MSATLALTKQLIECVSVTPDDAGCQQILSDRLEKLGFTITEVHHGDVKNIWAIRGNTSPLFVFAGHTDVVPTGDESQWQSPPFIATEKNGYLYGRGAADMKASIASMIVACEKFIEKHPNHKGGIGFIITSDEEGPAVHGTVKVVEHLKEKNIIPTYCLVGEPSCNEQLGDIIKVGRRGSLHAKLTIHGKQGHIAYPHLANNPIHQIAKPLNALLSHDWGKATTYFPATSCQISNIHSGTGARNVIPNDVIIDINWRFSDALTTDQVKQQTETLLKPFSLTYTIDWELSGQPFLAKDNDYIQSVTQAISKVTTLAPTLSTDGGTSDGRFIATLGCPVIEFGPCNKTIHQIDENVKIKDIDHLTECYTEILTNLLT